MWMNNRVRISFLLLIGLLSLPGLVLGQNHDMHDMHHGHNMDASDDEWRMPPMDMSMPMMPGIENELPPVEPFLPGAGQMANMLPEARPAEVVEMADGDTLDLEASLVRRTFNEQAFIMYGYNGMYPGPIIKADQGATIVVNFTNNIEMPTTMHWHGLRLDNQYDGIPNVTQKPVEVGDSFTYKLYFEDAGVYWYHPHMREDIQQDLGLYGNMLVKASAADYYNPVHREETLILDDILIDDRGMIAWGANTATHALMGRFGNVKLVNGQPDYRLRLSQGEVVRFNLTNVANSRTFNLLFDGAPIKLVASDVSRFEREAWVASVPIAPAERYVVEVKFDKPGTYAFTNTIQAIDHFRGEFYPHVDTLGIITVSETAVDEALASPFDVLREHTAVQEDINQYRAYFDKPVDKTLALTLAVKELPVPIMLSMEADSLYVPPIEWNDAMPMMNWLSTGHQVEWILKEPATGLKNMDIHWAFEKGDVIKLRIFNDPKTFHPMNHPFHIHGQRYLVLSIDGVPNQNLVWKDTALMPVGSTIDLLVDMSNPGDWMMHCHIAEHLEAGMMLHFSVAE
ncbi:MAG: multicopper oxidase family protein [Bacteroidota bacterium]